MFFWRSRKLGPDPKPGRGHLRQQTKLGDGTWYLPQGLGFRVWGLGRYKGFHKLGRLLGGTYMMQIVVTDVGLSVN